jgi:V/A-type H+-transporting ATPase subunit E
MAGVDTIIKQIRDDADARAQEILAEARKKAQAGTDAAKEEAEQTVKGALVEAAKQSESYEARIQSQIGMQMRQAILVARQEVIGDVLRRACERIRGMDADRYFAVLEKQIERYAHSEDGEILLGKRDLERVPGEFGARAEAIAAKKGGHLKLSKTPAPIESGFLLRYGDAAGGDGIDENCTLEATLEEKREELTDLANRILWESSERQHE